MPGPGDQHADNAASANPFEEPDRRISEYSAQEIATLSSRLEKQLGPEYISSRAGPSGQKVHYLAAEKCINLANEVFGFNGWSSGIKNIQIDFVEESPSTGKISLGLSVIVRVTLKDGTFHEDIGYGHIENCKGKAAAFEKAKKEGTTDALKRALRNFGNVLGNCIYDKDYLAKVTKVKIKPTKWDVENLHRHADYVPVKREPDPEQAQKGQVKQPSGSFEDEFEAEDFDEADFSESHATRGHPDEVIIETTASMTSNGARAGANGHKPAQLNGKVPPSEQYRHGAPAPTGRGMPPRPQQAPVTAAHPMGNQSMPLVPQPHTPGPGSRTPQAMQVRPPMGPPQGNQVHNGNTLQRPQYSAPPAGSNVPNLPLNSNPHRPPVPSAQLSPAMTRPQPSLQQQQQQQQQQSINHPQTHQGQQTNQQQHQPPSRLDPQVVVGFYPARAASLIQESSDTAPPANAPSFNPHAESPSIRKTSGIDHSKSKPLTKEALGISTAAAGVVVVGAVGSNNNATNNGNGNGPRPNFTHPQLDATRKIGMPGSPSPMQNRGSYKPPGPAGGKRLFEGGGGGGGAAGSGLPRPPLNDVSVNAASDGPGDAKRARLGDV